MYKGEIIKWQPAATESHLISESVDQGRRINSLETFLKLRKSPSLTEWLVSLDHQIQSPVLAGDFFQYLHTVSVLTV